MTDSYIQLRLNMAQYISWLVISCCIIWHLHFMLLSNQTDMNIGSRILWSSNAFTKNKYTAKARFFGLMVEWWTLGCPWSIVWWKAVVDNTRYWVRRDSELGVPAKPRCTPALAAGSRSQTCWRKIPVGPWCPGDLRRREHTRYASIHHDTSLLDTTWRRQQGMASNLENLLHNTAAL